MERLPLTNEPSQGYACCDVVIVGAGPAGLMLASCLSRWRCNIIHVDDRLQTSFTGRADGIHPRSLDLLRNMDLKSPLMSHQPARAYETAFWTSSHIGSGIVRTSLAPSCPDSIDARYPYITLLGQGLIEQIFLSDMEKRGFQVRRPWTITSFEENSDHEEYPVLVRLAHVDGTASETVRAKYLFGGDGSRSFVRKKLGIGMTFKEPVSCIWAAIDGVVSTDFPDVKMCCCIRTKNGSAMVIPRENGMVRIYVQLASSADPDWRADRTATQLEIQNLIKLVLKPYHIEWKRVEWFSTYPIRQGLANHYTLDQRIYLGGDACHLHSPKAGQGMNTAFCDSHNLAWKINLVERGFAHRKILATYESERRAAAKILIEFDNWYAKLYSQQVPGLNCSTILCGKDVSPDFSVAYETSRSFVTGYGVHYEANILNWSPDHPAKSPLFRGVGHELHPGRLFTTANVTRVVDANRVHLEQAVPLNGSFRIYVFGGDQRKTSAALHDLAKGLAAGCLFSNCSSWMDNPDSCWETKHNPHSPFFTFCVIFLAGRQDIDIKKHVPGALALYSYHVYVDQCQTSSSKASAHSKAGFDSGHGGIVIVRPDGYVGAIVRLVEGRGTAEALNQYFAAISPRGMDVQASNFARSKPVLPWTLASSQASDGDGGIEVNYGCYILHGVRHGPGDVVGKQNVELSI